MRKSLRPLRAWSLALASYLVLTVVAFVSPSAVSAAGACPNEALRVGASVSLPDCRAFEMVSPVYKNSGDVTNESAIVSHPPVLSIDGQSLMIWSTASFAGASGNTTALGSPYLLSRTGSGWTTSSMEVPESQFLTPTGLETSSFGGTLDGQTYTFLARAVSMPGNAIDIYRLDSDGSIVDIGTALPATAPFGSVDKLVGEGLRPVGMSADGTHVFFRTTTVRWPFDTSEKGWQSVYEYSGTGNASPMLVGVDDNGHPIGNCGTILGGTQSFHQLNTATFDSETEENHNAISADGETVFFTVGKPPFACSAPTPPVDEVFARIDNGLRDAHTVAISEPTQEDCEQCNTSSGLERATFEGASEDGSKVFFTTTQALLGGDSSENIYEYDFGAPTGHRIIRVSGGDSTVSNPTASVRGEPVQISEDGSHVYFVANGVLTSTPNGQGQTAQEGVANLYVFERDASFPGGHTAFITTLASRDEASTGVTRLGDEELWAKIAGGSPKPGGANTTPDGRFLIFSSRNDLTPDDTSTVSQIFEYDSGTGSLVRISIGQNGFNDNGNTSSHAAEIPSPRRQYKLGGFIDPSPVDPRTYWSHMAMSADGSYVFFTSGAALTPTAREGVPDEERNLGEGSNVYEYHDGNVYLISRASKTESPLIGTDASGGDVFIGTTEQLSGRDTDSDGDIYDARIGGGFLAPTPPPGCSGDACQGSLGGAPVLLSPGSEFQAGGNPPLAGSHATAKAVKKKAKPKKRRKKKAKRSRGARLRSGGGGK